MMHWERLRRQFRFIAEKAAHLSLIHILIGSIAIMERAAKVLGKELKYNKIEDPSEAKYEFGTVDIIETGDYDTDSIEWGKVQALAGRMAVDWIMKSIELGQAGKIDAVSTAPIHKGAIKLIGVKEPGHTEIYQNATHSPYALTMFLSLIHI